MCYSPTFTREVSTFVYESTPPWVSDPFFTKGVPPEIVAQLTDPERQEQTRANPAAGLGQQYKSGLEVAKKNLKALVDQGVRIAMGTDTGPPARFQGYFEHLELEMMVEAGLTPMQVLVSATGDAARCHRNADLGVLARGRVADLLVLGANPIENIRNMRIDRAGVDRRGKGAVAVRARHQRHYNRRCRLTLRDLHLPRITAVVAPCHRF